MLFLRQKADSIDVSFMSGDFLVLLFLFKIKQNNVREVVRLGGSSKQKLSVVVELDRKQATRPEVIIISVNLHHIQRGFIKIENGDEWIE